MATFGETGEGRERERERGVMILSENGVSGLIFSQLGDVRGIYTDG